MDMHRKYTVDTVIYKGKPLTECTNEELNLATKWTIRRTSAMSKEVNRRMEFASLFVRALPGKGGQKIIETVLSLTNRRDELRNQAEQIKMEIERRRNVYDGRK